MTSEQDYTIYAITNTKNGRVYVGSTSRFKQRWLQHKIDLRNRVHHSKALQADYDLFGLAVFKCEVVGRSPRRERFAREAAAIRRFDAASLGYNSYPEATPLGVKRSPEAIAKGVAAIRGRKQSDETKAKIGGWLRTPEYRANVSAAQRGKLKSDQHRAKLSAALTGKTRGPQSAEQVAKRVAATRATKAAKAAKAAAHVAA